MGCARIFQLRGSHPFGMNLDRAIRKESWLANETFRLHLITPSYHSSDDAHCADTWSSA